MCIPLIAEGPGEGGDTRTNSHISNNPNDLLLIVHYVYNGGESSS